MRAAAGGLLGLCAVLIVLMLTVGKENDFGFACFLAFVAALVALLVLGGVALRRRSGRRLNEG